MARRQTWFVHWIVQILKALAKGDSLAAQKEVKAHVEALCKKYPLYPELKG